MKAITLTQPWATLVALGIKTVETRSWAPPRNLIGQRIAIHASRETIPKEELDPETWQTLQESGAEIPNSAVVATAVLVDHWTVTRLATANGVRTAFGRTPDNVQENRSMPLDPHGDYRRDRHLWVLEGVVPLEPAVKARGYPGPWNWDPSKE